MKPLLGFGCVIEGGALKRAGKADRFF